MLRTETVAESEDMYVADGEAAPGRGKGDWLFAGRKDDEGTDLRGSEPHMGDGGRAGDGQVNRLEAYVSRLVELNALGPGVTAEAAADHIYALAAPDVYLLLTRDRGWTPEAYEAWLSQMLAHALLTVPGSAPG